MAELPLKIRVDIRDKWDAPTSSVKTAVNSLHKTLGHKISPEVEWSAIWAESKDRFSDKSTFVPTISGFLIAWYERLIARLENDVYSQWTDELLDVLSESSRNVVLYVQPSRRNTSSRPSTTWNKKTASFILAVPNAESIPLSKMLSGFDEDFEKLFVIPGEATVVGKDDGWADVMDDEDLQSVAVSSSTHATTIPAQSNIPERLPTVDMLPRPGDLLPATTPYIMIIDVLKHDVPSITVQCSHQPTLELMSSYLDKWGKKKHGDMRNINMLRIELNDSDFSYGVIDSLTIWPTTRGEAVNPVIVIAFIEGILGYKMVYTDGSRWVYRSDKRLK